METTPNVNADFSKETNFGSSYEERAAAFRQELDKLRNTPVENEVQTHSQDETTQRVDEQSDRSDDDSVDNSADIEPIHRDSVESEEVSVVDDEKALDNKRIPKKRLDQEIKRRAELEEQLRAERDARIAYETKLNMYNEAMQKLNSNNQNLSKPEFEPIDDVAHNFYLSKIQELEKKIEQSTQNLTATQTQARFEHTINTQAAEFSAKHPDFNDAYKFVVDAEVKNAKLLGYDDAEAQTMAMQKLQPIAWKVYEKGGNIAETVYNMAKNYGYNNAPAAKKPGLNLKNIDSNMKKSQSIIDDVPAKVTDMSRSTSSYTKRENFDALLNEDGHGVNVSKFHEVLNRVRQGH